MGINAWYNGLEPTLRIYWSIAIFTTLIFAIQMVLTLIGIGDTDTDVDGADAAGMSDGNGDTLDTGGAVQLFTIRNLVNFLLGVGWGGVCFYHVIPNRVLLCAVAFLCGCAFVLAFVVMFRQMMKLEDSGNFRIEECVGQTCSVYLRIPASRAGNGKVQVSYHGSVLELTALTEHPQQIPSGSKVRIIEVVDGSTVLVEPLA